MATKTDSRKRPATVDTGGIAQGLAALHAALKVERRITLEEANAQGYYTSQQIADSSGFSRSCINNQLAKLVRAGRVERVFIGGKLYAFKA